VYEVRKAKGGAILDVEDAIKDVLDDDDFVTVGEYDVMATFSFCSLE
jgi:histidine ammonia-lyase